MKHSLIDILIRPDVFFQDVSGERENFKFPGLIVMILAIIGAVTAYFISSPIAQMMDGIQSGLGALTIVGASIVSFIGAFVFWILWTGVFYLVSSLFKGSGTFKKSLEFIGYGYLPQIFGAILTVIVAIQFLPSVVVRQISASAVQENPQLIQEAVNNLMHDPAMMEMTQITAIISIVFLLWSAQIWISGMKNARHLSVRDSALCVGIPVVAYILYIIYTMTGI
ncbi:MAG: YIP1 family protein [Methanoregula sp.]|jgi:hypothetical protein